MGDLRAWSPERNDVVLEEGPLPALSSTSLLSSSLVSSYQAEAAISPEYWQTAEAAIQGIIAQVLPTVVSDERRKAVIDYVQRLIKNSLGCEVFPFGSVPLKTYLPDGDIDLTAFGSMNVEELLANDVCSVLEMEDKNMAAEFVVKDVQVIRAEVKLVKCLVQNIVVDISFNQLGGLCTLCFLEQVDRLVGKDHLFKRSVTLVKAWCYYESRILGAHHGLISTYALETLVLFIFYLFHSSLDGPLAVLYKFLDYFSKFDWDNYCVSLNGPVRISSLPEVVVEAPEKGGCDRLLSTDFLNDCVQKFSVPARGFETNSRTFSPKHLNIVDPLKENNNLGRSVSKGNFYRIRSAFTYGARKLGRILSLPQENVADELRKFFSNTLDRHGSGQRPDVQDPIPVNGHYGFFTTASLPGRESCQEEQIISGLESAYSRDLTEKCSLDNEQSFQFGVNNVKVSRWEMNFSRSITAPHNSVTAVSENRISGDAKDLASSRIQGLLISDDLFKSSTPNVGNSVTSTDKAHSAPHPHFFSSIMRNEELRNGSADWKHSESCNFSEERISSGTLPRPGEEMGYVGCRDPDDNLLIINSEARSPTWSINHPVPFSPINWSSEDPGYSSNQTSVSTTGKSDGISTLSVLDGDYQNHLNSLYYGRCWYEYALNVPVPSMSPPMATQLQGKSSWDVIRRSVQFRGNGISQMNVDVVTGPLFYPMSPPLLPGTTFGIEEMPKPRGTGTYFPNTTHYRDRRLIRWGRTHSSMRYHRNNCHIIASQETNLPERKSRELTQLHFHQGGGKSVSSVLHHPGSSETKPQSNVKDSVHPSDIGLEIGSIRNLPTMAPFIAGVSQPNSGSAAAQNSSVSLLTQEIRRPKLGLDVDQDWVALQSYQLKEDDFPPLSDSSGKGLPICMVKKLEERTNKC